MFLGHKESLRQSFSHSSVHAFPNSFTQPFTHWLVVQPFHQSTIHALIQSTTWSLHQPAFKVFNLQHRKNITCTSLFSTSADWYMAEFFTEPLLQNMSSKWDPPAEASVEFCRKWLWMSKPTMLCPRLRLNCPQFVAWWKILHFYNFLHDFLITSSIKIRDFRSFPHFSTMFLPKSPGSPPLVFGTLAAKGWAWRKRLLTKGLRVIHGDQSSIDINHL